MSHYETGAERTNAAPVDSAPTHVALSRENGVQRPAPVDSGAIGRLNEAARALHVMRWTYEDGGARAEAVCLAAPDADCRLVGAGPECSCEWWGRIERRDDGTIWHLLGELDGKGYAPQPGDWHRVIPQGDCNVCLFINESGCAEELTPDGEHHRFVIADVPFEPVWENDGCSWRPTPMALANLLREHADRALAEVEEERDEIAGRLSGLLCELTGGLLSKTGYSVRDMVTAIESEFEKGTREEIADALADIESVVASRREAFLPSPNLDPAWIAGWHAAVDDVTNSVRAARQERDSR